MTPYASDYAGRIPPHFLAQGYACVSQVHAGLSDNLSYSTVADADISAMIAATVERPDAIILYCTNFPGAHLVAELEAETGIAIYAVLGLRVEVAAADRRTDLARAASGAVVSPVLRLG